MSGTRVTSGVCYDFHNATPGLVDCLAPWQSLIQGLICVAVFGHLLRKMHRAHKRALAGYAKNTINIVSHNQAFFGVIIFYLLWGIGCVFDINRQYKYTTLSSPGLEGKDLPLLLPLLMGSCICRGFSNFIEMYILFLIVSNSIGRDAYFKARSFAFVTSMIYTPLIAAVIIWVPGESTIYWPLENLAWLYLARDLALVIIHLFFLVYARHVKVDSNNRINQLIKHYLIYMISMYGCFCLSRGFYMTTNVALVNLGICVEDFSHFLQYLTYGPVAYLILKRDCQYWGTDIDEEEEETLTSHTENMTWSEGASKMGDVIIPKTEIYFRKILVSQFDISVEIHFWRRQLVVVKRFKFDLLTRDNIKYFKNEALIFKQLKHPNVISFHGILVDPPTLGIVMKHASRGDLFKFLEATKKNATAALLVESPRDVIPSISKHANNGNIESNSIIEENSTAGTVGSSTSPSIELTVITNSGDDYLQESDISSSSSPNQRALPRIMSRLSMLGTTSNELSKSDGTFRPLVCALQIAHGMAYLHSKDILHRDLKSLNVLLDEQFNALIADFGESEMEAKMGIKKHMNSRPGQAGEDNESELYRNLSMGVGTPGWAAPESLSGQGTSKGSDVFSFGVILWELITWLPPSVYVPANELLVEPLSRLPGISELLEKQGVISPKTLSQETHSPLRKHVDWQQNPNLQQRLILVDICDLDRAIQLMGLQKRCKYFHYPQPSFQRDIFPAQTPPPLTIAFFFSHQVLLSLKICIQH